MSRPFRFAVQSYAAVFTTLRRGELSKGMLAAMLRQLDIDGKEF